MDNWTKVDCGFGGLIGSFPDSDFSGRIYPVNEFVWKWELRQRAKLLASGGTSSLQDAKKAVSTRLTALTAAKKKT